MIVGRRLSRVFGAEIACVNVGEVARSGGEAASL